MAKYEIRIFGDPILNESIPEVESIDDSLVLLAKDMISIMQEASGVGLAASQIGVKKRMFVYDIGGGPQQIINPTIIESDGTWTYEEGCLSVPGWTWPIARPKKVFLKGLDIDGNEISIEADELLGRVFQHELDHLNGILLIKRLDPDLRKEAMSEIRKTFFAMHDLDTQIEEQNMITSVNQPR
ncbi:MAG: peptide deformylase [Actinobacteria bacterium]|nr:peptide deformylase [Actinomycetota bacterium]MCL6105151.1 peptide deformylase [Actinomycetota bacterium]